jgi:hypothetical protein
MNTIVDIYDTVSNTWRTASLSKGRYGLAATSLPDLGVAIFVGGKTETTVNDEIDIFNSNTDKWTTAVLSAARYFLAATSLPKSGMAFIGGGHCA